MSLIVQKRKRSLEVDGGVIGNGDVIDGLRFTRRGYTWQVESSAADNRILLRDKFADYQLDVEADQRRLKCHRRYPTLEALPVQGKIAWVGGDKPIKFKVSPQNVFVARARRLVSDQMPDIPQDSKGLVPVETKGQYAAIIETGGRHGPRLMDLVLRAGTDVDKVVEAVKSALRDYTSAPSTTDVNTALADALSDVDLFETEAAPSTDG